MFSCSINIIIFGNNGLIICSSKYTLIVYILNNKVYIGKTQAVKKKQCFSKNIPENIIIFREIHRNKQFS